MLFQIQSGVLIFLLSYGVASVGLMPTSAQAQTCAEPVTVVRMEGDVPQERTRMRLLDCNGNPDPVALEELSVLARGQSVEAPAPQDRFANGRLRSGRFHRMNPELLRRLQSLRDHFGDREIQIVSGHRPRSRRTSRHHTGRALDLRVEGVPRQQVAAFARTLSRTGVGYYPNSTFTHIDIRERSYHWVDTSAPGQRANYRRAALAETNASAATVEAANASEEANLSEAASSRPSHEPEASEAEDSQREEPEHVATPQEARDIRRRILEEARRAAAPHQGPRAQRR